MNVDTDWAPGSSGAAVLDEFGNAIGQVAAISAMEEENSSAPKAVPDNTPAFIVFHHAVSAREVLALIQSGR